MLKIRLSRTGKSGQPSYRIVVAEHTAPIKGKFVEQIGFYNISRTPRQLEVEQDRVEYWISKGAQPTDRLAVLFKELGMKGMEKYIEPRNKKRKKKKETPESASAPTAVVTEASAAEAPAAEAPVEAPAEPAV